MSPIQEWFHEHPRARPLIMFAGLGFFCLIVGIWLTARPPATTPKVNRTPDVASTEIPTLTGEETPLPQRPKVVWTAKADTDFYKEPALNQPVARKLPQWEEMAWIQEQDVWDQVRLQDGTEGWIQSRYLTFTRPANLSRPSDAEVTVMKFYQAVVRKDYAAAYAYLSGDWKSELDFQAFVLGYSRTNSLRTEITQVIPMGDNRFQIDVAMKADEMGQDVPYLGTYVVEKQGEDWYMASGSLTQQGGPRIIPSPDIQVPVSEPSEAPDESLPPAEEDPTPTPSLEAVSPTPE